jgi:hypothetical protein
VALPRSGSIVASLPGQTISALNVEGTITVRANHVTIVNSKVNSTVAGSGSAAIVVEDGVVGTVISNTTVAGKGVGYAVPRGSRAQHGRRHDQRRTLDLAEPRTADRHRIRRHHLRGRQLLHRHQQPALRCGAAYYYLGGGQVWEGKVWDDNSESICPDGSLGCEAVPGSLRVRGSKTANGAAGGSPSGQASPSRSGSDQSAARAI